MEKSESGKIQKILSALLESNEIPYIIPRAIIGSIIIVLILDMARRAGEFHFHLFKDLPPSVAAFILLAWLTGYAIDALSIATIRSSVGASEYNAEIFFKTLEGYRFLLMTSLFWAGIMSIVLHTFSWLVAPKINIDFIIDFSFFLVLHIIVGGNDGGVHISQCRGQVFAPR